MEKREHELAESLRRTAVSRLTLELPAVWECFYAVYPELRANVGSRQQLAAGLRTLAEAGILSFPASKSSYDRTALPPLPRFVRLLSLATVQETKFDHRTFPWSLPMSFVAGLARLPSPDHVRRLNDFFRNGGAIRPLVPVKERSYDIFGNEKILERVLDGQLGYKGRLTLDLLRCYRVPLVPVHLAFENGASDVLIVENEATFDTVLRWNRLHSQFRTVIYGRGKEVEKAVHFILNEIQSKPGTVYYFGDLDRHGIEMPYRLSRSLVQQGGRPVVPSLACYRLLLRRAPSSVTSLEAADDRESPADDNGQAWHGALEWLPMEIRDQVESVLATDQRIAQEATGWELLEHETSLA